MVCTLFFLIAGSAQVRLKVEMSIFQRLRTLCVGGVFWAIYRRHARTRIFHIFNFSTFRQANCFENQLFISVLWDKLIVIQGQIDSDTGTN
jgi:hypothetical protein